MEEKVSESSDQKPVEEDPKTSPKAPDVNVVSVFMANSKTPSHALNGISSGMKSLSLSTLGGVALLVALPVKGAVDGYEYGGVLGGMAGSLVGTLGGAVTCSGLVLTGTFTMLYQMINGLIRTPSAVYHGVQGKEWDSDAEEWIYYDLRVEAGKLESLTEEQFVLLMKKHSVSSIYSPQPLVDPPNNNGETETSNELKNRPKKNILDRELYDVLGVEPEATAAEIKKAYYSKAREFHPDRNPSAEAKARFQKIGQAYQILGDDSSRSDYDNRGKASIDSSQQQVDISMIYMLFFGTDQFESLIGELQVSMIIKHLFDASQKPSEIMRFRQRKRELSCALAMAQKLDLFLQGDVEMFRKKAEQEVENLCETVMGVLLLRYIGSVYSERANLYLSALNHVPNTLVGKPVRSVTSVWQYMSTGISTLIDAWSLQGMMSQAAAEQLAEDKRNGLTEEESKQKQKLEQQQREMMGNMTALYGPNPTPEKKKKVHQRLNLLSKHVLQLVWHFTKQDIRQTLKTVCKKLLNDRGVSEQSRHLRAQGIAILGDIFSNYVPPNSEIASGSVSEEQGLNSLLNKIAHQTGFGAAPGEHDGQQAFFDVDDEEDSDGSDSGDTSKASKLKAKYENWLMTVNDMSVKELKAVVIELGGDVTSMVEKDELRKFVKDKTEEKLKLMGM